MSDGKNTYISSIQRLLSVLVEPERCIDMKDLEPIIVRLSEIEKDLKYARLCQEKNEADISGISTTTAMLLKTILRLTLQMQILYDKLGLDMQEEIERMTSGAVSSEDEDPGESGGGMGGMLN